MMHPTDLSPVAIALEAISTTDTIQFFGIDLESGERVRVTLEIDQSIDGELGHQEPMTPGVILMLTLARHS